LSWLLQKELKIDLDEIFVWYEEQQPELGLRFMENFEEVLDKIERNPYYAFCIEEMQEGHP
jgi:hypothetical protein